MLLLFISPEAVYPHKSGDSSQQIQPWEKIKTHGGGKVAKHALLYLNRLQSCLELGRQRDRIFIEGTVKQGAKLAAGDKAHVLIVCKLCGQVGGCTWIPIWKTSISQNKNTEHLLLLSHFSRVRLCDPIDGSPPGSSVPGILQARTLEWVAISFSNACK